MKKNIPLLTMVLILLSAGFCGAADVPTNVSLSPDLGSITVNWRGDSDAESYNVYWSTDRTTVQENSESVPHVSGRLDYSFTIQNLETGVTYYVAVSSVDTIGDSPVESDLSAILSGSTLEDESPPATPTGFGVTSLNAVTATTVPLRWNANSEEDIASYEIAFRPNPNNISPDPILTETNGVITTEITNLSPSTRYFFTLRAIDDAENTSDPTPELVVDLPVDTFPPFVPAGISATLSGNQDVSVQIESGNQNMADYSGNIIYYGQTPGQLDNSVDVGTSLAYTFSGLPENTTWYFAATAYDNAGETPAERNESDMTAEVAVTIEEIEGFLDESDDFDGGCFIGSLWDSPDYDVRENKNKVGISAGYYKPAESDFKDFYGNDTYPVAIFYDRGLGRYLSIDLKAGFLQESGELITVSGAPTAISSDLTLVPVAASLNVNFPLLPYIWGFVGIGPDYWYIEEESDLQGSDELSEWVGGYHGRIGFWLYNRDPDYKDWGAVFETSYSRIDRFGDNDLDMGGWMFLLGLFYSF